LKFTNVKSFVKFNSPQRYIIEDEDGTLTSAITGKSHKSGWVVPYYVHNLIPKVCYNRRWDYGGIVCDSTVTIRKIRFSGGDESDIRILRLDPEVDAKTAPRKMWSSIFF